MRIGFSLLKNYWCDLLDETTYGGRPNPARPVALLATTLLCAGLANLWWRVPTLYPPDASRRAILVRAFGVASGLATPLVATRFHDIAIDLAVLLGVLAFAGTMSALGKRAGPALARLSAVALALVSANYLMWRTRIGISALPLVQKAAFVAFLTWVVVVARRVDSATRASSRSP